MRWGPINFAMRSKQFCDEVTYILHNFAMGSHQFCDEVQTMLRWGDIYFTQFCDEVQTILRFDTNMMRYPGIRVTQSIEGIPKGTALDWWACCERWVQFDSLSKKGNACSWDRLWGQHERSRKRFWGQAEMQSARGCCTVLRHDMSHSEDILERLLEVFFTNNVEGRMRST